MGIEPVSWGWKVRLLAEYLTRIRAYLANLSKKTQRRDLIWAERLKYSEGEFAKLSDCDDMPALLVMPACIYELPFSFYSRCWAGH